MRRYLLPAVVLTIAASLEPAAAATAPRNDYPTAERVEYVQACMRDHPDKSRHEMLYKCSCALDAIAREVPYEQYVEISTAANALSIGGKRGEAVREAKTAKDMAAKFRAVKSKAEKSCFIGE